MCGAWVNWAVVKAPGDPLVRLVTPRESTAVPSPQSTSTPVKVSSNSAAVRRVVLVRRIVETEILEPHAQKLERECLALVKRQR